MANRILFLTVLGLSIAGWTGTYGQEIARTAPLCQIAPNAANQSLPVPQGAIWEKETIRVATTPENFGAVLGWINVATVVPCVTKNTDASVEIRAVRVIEVDPETNAERVAQEVNFRDGANSFTGRIFPRLNKQGKEQWFGVTEGSDERTIHTLVDGAFQVNMAQAANTVWHGWTEPRVEAVPGKSYRVEVEARINGAARLQLGTDYWVNLNADYNGYDDHCRGTNNCEAWISRWYGDTNGQFITIRAPRSF
ncbi:MAG: hypothetical protein AAB519_02410 [Patescibacteria group bacterium]